MDLGTMTMFTSLKKRMEWISNRQEVLAQNIANADTPGFRSRDLVGFNFEDLMRREKMFVKPVGTNAKHMGVDPATMAEYASKHERPYETTIDDNQVVLEEQVMKMNESTIDHELTTELYRKNIALFKLALGRR